MTGISRCQAPTTMMGRGADGGCGTEEKPCPVTRISPAAKTPAGFPASLPEKLEKVNLGVDLYSQAFKALSERSPFDSDEVLGTTSATLPNGLASLLSKHSDSKKKHKRPPADAKSNRKGLNEKPSIWVELEDYFRELRLQDVERLYPVSSLFSSLGSRNSCFLIPGLGNEVRNCLKSEIENADVSEKTEECVEIDNESSESVAVVEEGSLPLPQWSSVSCSSVEWVLGSRKRVLLTTTRPNKKRKLVGETAGLERLNVAQCCEGSSILCHICSVGETGDQLNQLVSCKSCDVVVHKKCYGVQGEIDESWLCSWCKHVKTGQVSGSDKHCVLCPKQGGALKPFRRAGAGNDESVEFAHLFCSQWMPEVYIDDTRLMEPLHSLGAAKDVRVKLVCNLCKVKKGFCIRCSDGSCRTSFHPICAREAGNKLEIWGKFGCDDIELRAFCAKHSGNVGDSGKNEHKYPAASDSHATSNQPPVLSVNKIKKLKIGCKNGDKVTFHVGGAESTPKHLGEAVSEEVPKDANAKHIIASGDGQEVRDVKTLDSSVTEDVRAPSLLDLGLVLKKLIDRGKVSLEQVASDIDISTDSLASTLTESRMGPELYNKILKWLTDHAHLDNFPKDLKARGRSVAPIKTGVGAADNSDAVAVRDLDITDVVPFKSVPPRRRTVGNIRIFKEGNVMSLWNDEVIGNGVVTRGMDEDSDDSNKGSVLDNVEKKNIDETVEDSLEGPSPDPESSQLTSNNLSHTEHNSAEEGFSIRSPLLDLDQDMPSCSSLDIVKNGNVESGANSFVHPYVKKKLEETQSRLKQGAHSEFHGFEENEKQSHNTDSFCSDDKFSDCVDKGEGVDGVNLDDSFLKAKEKGLVDLFPEDELEGEIIYFQQRLLANAVQRKKYSDQLIRKVVKNLPHEISAVRKRKWENVLVNQYIHELKEARKQGRKERRQKEAQAVLAAATAAVAASSRNSSFRKDAVDDTIHQENQLKMENSRVRSGISSQLVPRTKDIKSSLAVPRGLSGGCSDLLQFSTGSPKEHPKLCDICRRPESILNSILVCSSCKVAVHLNCYRSVKESTGPWYCELCEELSLLNMSSPATVDSSEKPPAECGLCGASNGAFRKSSNGQWVHAFCAEWIFDSKFKRGQVCPVEGMETLLKGNDACAVCNHKHGVCIKCNYGNCQSTFHPSCARSAGYYMYAKSLGGGKMQHKAYCSKHSLEQRAKAETQRHASEDLKIAKQYRVELEKLRLLCERIVKREKLKRELVLCNHEILASKRDSVAVSRFVRRPYISHEMSSESATTSLRGDFDGSRSCSEAIEKADDVTVDSALSIRQSIRLPLSIDNDQKTDDSSTSQHIPTPKPSNRVSFAGKQMPVRAAMACRNFPDNEEMSRRNAETFEKELVMTSDQASLKNRRLPKGYIYVPIDCLSNRKQVNRGSVDSEKLDG